MVGNNLQVHILKTIVYADIFHYPLQEEEIWRLLISGKTPKKINKKEFSKVLKDLVLRKNAPIEHLYTWYFLAGRKNIIKIRKARQKESERKMIIARRVIRFLSIIPTVKLIGISGALALENAKIRDDIDLFVITKRKTLWLTRLLILGFLQLLGKRRKWGETSINNKICVNMLMDESSLSFPRQRCDIFTAHEIAQLKVIFEKENTHMRFLAANSWAKKILPNAFGDVMRSRLFSIKETNESLFLRLFEQPAKTIQYWQIRKHQTTEVISDSLLAFHPLDYRKKTLQKYKEKLKTTLLFDIMVLF